MRKYILKNDDAKNVSSIANTLRDMFRVSIQIMLIAKTVRDKFEFTFYGYKEQILDL